MKTANRITDPEAAHRTASQGMLARAVADPSLSPESRAVIESLTTGKAIDPEIAGRIHEKARKIRERIFKEQGLIDIAVPGAREFRGEIPSS